MTRPIAAGDSAWTQLSLIASSATFAGSPVSNSAPSATLRPVLQMVNPPAGNEPQ